MNTDDMNNDRRRLVTAALATGAATALGVTTARSADSPDSAKIAASVPASPALTLSSEFAFTISITLGDVLWIKPSTQGSTRAAVYAQSGEIVGPAIRGIVVPQSGGDWPLVRPDGVIDFDARYLLRTDDGVVIYMQNRGFRWGSPEVMAAMARHEPVAPGSYYMRTSPKFDAPEGRYAWMSKHVFVGIGEKTPQGNAIHYFKIL